MIQVYTYTSAMNVLKKLQENKIVTLDVYTGEYIDKPSQQYLINYTTIQEYPARERPSILKLFERNIITTSQAVSEFSEFIEKKYTDSVLSFKLSYSILKPKITVNKLYEKYSDTAVPNLPDLIDSLETEITRLGIHKEIVPLFEKIQTQGQKRPKYRQTDLCGIINVLREALNLNETGK